MTTAVDDDAFVMPSFIGSFITHLALLIATAAAVAPLRVTVDDPARDDGSEHPDEPFGWSTSEELSRLAVAEAAEFQMWGLPGASYEGAMGDPEGPARAGRFGVLGPHDNADPHIANARWTGDRCWSCIGLQSVFDHSDLNAPIAPWGRDDSLGQDSESARGNFWADNIGAALASSDGSRGDGGRTGYGDGAGGPLPSYVHRCRLQ